MKKITSIVLSVLLVLMIIPTAYAANGEVNYTDLSPTIDGQMEAIWETANVYHMPNYIVAVHDNEKLDPKKDPDDFSGEWRALWDDQYFYLLVHITDPTRVRVNVDRGQNVNYDDSIQVFIQPNAETSYTSGLFHIDNAKGEFWHGPPNWASLKDPSAIQYVVNDYGDGYILEMSVPWDQVGEGGMKPAPGAQLLLDVHAVDNDLGHDRSAIGTEGRYPQSKLTWSDLLNKAYEDASHLGTITLSKFEEDQTPPNFEAPGESGSSGTTVPSSPSVPQMPKTGMGGASDPSASWIVAVMAILFVAFVAVRKYRSQL